MPSRSTTRWLMLGFLALSGDATAEHSQRWLVYDAAERRLQRCIGPSPTPCQSDPSDFCLLSRIRG